MTVHHRPARLVPVDTGYLDRRDRFLRGPEAFTQEQLLGFAEQVTHNP
ncbi:hypothetical protein [Modestobacter sp. SYSU DS0511]